MVEALGSSADPRSRKSGGCLELAETWPESALALNNAAWALVKLPDSPEADSRRGLRLAERPASSSLEQRELSRVSEHSWRGSVPHGSVRKAQATLNRSNQLNRNREPADLAFLAMTQHRLDQVEAARATLERLREVMKDPKTAANEENQGFLREAESVILNSSDLPEDVIAPHQ